ncbi:hypothetical protein FD755_017000 [Muntiacus reevesi]|uniref:Activating molecule in BECN1-regulated autophagy protein 1 n=1 Tax=Muntiacus reevesi TaxID=9886 RepID=A0A5N3X8R0_MUNRE|nr:hypothetical protein FD755_017000 [Muntiacus reevesi]
MKVVPEKNAVRILWGRERGTRTFGAQRLLQELVEDKTRCMKWEGKRVELPDSPRSTFLLAFSPDRTLLASTHVNHNIYITEVKTGKCVHSLIGHRRTPWCVTFHPTISGLIASGCLDGEVRIWDLHGGSESWFTDSNNAIASLAFHPTAQLLLIATANEIHFWDWSRREPFAVVKTASEMERVRLVRFDPLGHYLLTAIVNPSNQQGDDDPEIPIDGAELSHYRQRALLQSQPVRRTPLLHNFLHMLSSRSSGIQVGEQSTVQEPATPSPPPPPPQPSTERPRTSAYIRLRQRVSYPTAECCQHLGILCLCSRCSGTRVPSLLPHQDSVPPASARATTPSFSFVQTEPFHPPEQASSAPHDPGLLSRPSAFSTVQSSTAGNTLRNLSLGPPRRSLGGPLSGHPSRYHRDIAPGLTGSEWTRTVLSLNSRSEAESMPPPRTSASSVSLLSVLRQQEGGSQASVYTSATEGRGFPASGLAAESDGGNGSSQNNPGSIRHELQCDLRRFFLEYDRLQELDQSLSGEAPQAQQAQEMLNNNLESERPGPSHQPTPHSSENNSNLSRGHLNRCRACHNLLTFNNDTLRWERSAPNYSSGEASSSWQVPGPFEGMATSGSQLPPLERTEGQTASSSRLELGSAASPQEERTVGVAFNQETGHWERIYTQASRSGTVSQEALHQDLPEESSEEDSLRRLSPAAYYAQRMIQYLSRRDSIRQRSMRYQQNRLRSSTSSSSSDNQGPSVEGADLEFEDFEDNGDRSRHRAPRNARMSAPSLGRFVPRRFLLPEYLPYAGIFHERGQPGLATHSSVNRVLADTGVLLLLGSLWRRRQSRCIFFFPDKRFFSFLSFSPRSPSTANLTGFELSASCSKFPLALYFTYGSVSVSALLSQFVPSSPSLAVSTGPFTMSAQNHSESSAKMDLQKIKIHSAHFLPQEPESSNIKQKLLQRSVYFWGDLQKSGELPLLKKEMKLMTGHYGPGTAQIDGVFSILQGRKLRLREVNVTCPGLSALLIITLSCSSREYLPKGSSACNVSLHA